MARLRLAGEERAHAIIQATLQLFADKGFSGATTRQIARAAGVSEALVFKHFPSKKLLYRAILRAKIEEADRVLPLDERLASLGDEAFFLHIALTVMRRVEKDPTFLRLLMRSAIEGHELAREFDESRGRRTSAFVKKRIETLQGLGEYRGDLDPALAARTFQGMVLQALLARHLFHDPVSSRMSLDRTARTLVGIFLDGVRAGKERS